MAEPIYYTPDGVEVPLSTIEQEAKANNITIDEVISKNNYTTEKLAFEPKINKDFKPSFNIPKNLGKTIRKEDGTRIEEKPIIEPNKKTIVKSDGNSIKVNEDINLKNASFESQMVSRIVKHEPNVNYQHENKADDISNTFIADYYDPIKLASVGVNKDDFAGWLNTSNRYKQLSEDINKGIYKPKANVYSDLKEKALFESNLSALLDDYASYRDERRNDINAINALMSKKQKKFSKENKSINSEIKDLNLTKVTEFGEDFFNYKKEQFSNLTEFELQQQEKLIKKINQLEKRTDLDDAIAAPANAIGSVPIGAFEQGRNLLVELGGLFSDDWAKKQRLLIDFSDKNRIGNKLDYTYFDGKSTVIDGVEYGLEEDGSIYNLTHGYRANEVLNPPRYKYLVGKIKEEGKEKSDWNGRGGSKQLGNVVGGVLFQLAGAYTTGGATTLLGRGAQALGASKAIKLTRNTKGIIDNTLFQSFYGAMNGQESTLKAAYDAGLSDEEAENLAGIAAKNMGVLYAVTGPIAPRLPALKAMDDALTKGGAWKRIVNAYNGTKSYKAADAEVKSIINSFIPSKQSVVTFAKEGGKETVQENIQQAGEYTWVNKRTNELAQQDIIKDEYTEKDIKVTSALSFATGGLVSRLGNINNRPYNKNKIFDLYTVGNNLKGAETRLNDAVSAGKINKRQANKILNDAKNVKEAYDNNSIPPYISSVDPEAYVKIAGLQSKLNGLKQKKKGFGKLSDPRLDQEIEKIENQIQKAAEPAAKKIIEEDIEVASKYATVKKFKNAEEAQAAGIKDLDANTDGIIEKDGTIYINEEIAAKNNIAVASHELLHKILKKQFNVEGLPTEQQANILKDFKSLLDEAGLLASVEERMKLYKEQGIDVEGKAMDEYFTAFSDILGVAGKQGLDIQALRKNKSLGQKIANFIENILAQFGVAKKFKKAEDVWDFIIDYQKNFQQGKLTKQAKAQLKAGEKIKGDTKKSLTKLSPEIEKEVGENIKSLQEARKNAEDLAKKFNKPYQKTPQETKIENNIIQKIKPTVDSFVESRTKDLFDPIPKDARKGIDRSTFRESMKTDIHTMVFDEYKALQTIEKFIVNRGYLRSNALAKSLGIKETIDKQIDESTENILDEENKIIGEDKIYNIEKAFTPSQIEDIDAELLTIARIFTTKISETALNKKSSDFIRDFKKRAKKSQAVSLIKESLKVKGKVNPNRFLKLKKPVLEGTTTTYLSRAYPEVIEKSVDGKYENKIFKPNFVKFPEWQGKKIDREKTSTDAAGRTAGHDLVRRIKKPSNVLSDLEFLQKSFKNIKIEDGKVLPIDPKKSMNPVSQNSIDSPITQVATEALLSRFVTKLNEGDNEISNAFERVQAIKGQILAENYIANVTMQAEEGGVKKSISFPRAANILVNQITLRGLDNVLDAENNVILEGKIAGEVFGPNEFNKITGYSSDGNILPPLGSFVKNVFDLGFITDEPTMRFMQSVKKSKIIQKVLKDTGLTFDNAITKRSTAEALNGLAIDMSKTMKALGSQVINTFSDKGQKMFGFYNRVLDPASRKQDEIATTTAKLNNPNAKTIYLTNPDGSFVEGKYYQKFKNTQESLKSIDVPDLDLNDIKLMNSQKGIMKKISNVVNSDASVQEKLKAIEKLSPEIQAANVANKELAKYIVKIIRAQYKAGNIKPTSVLAFFQQQTSADEGLRALSGWLYVTVLPGKQGVMKGEHLEPNANTMFKLAELILDENIGDIQFDNLVDEALMFHDQWLENKEDLKIIDAPGSTIDAADTRILINPNRLKNIYTTNGAPALEFIEARNQAFKLRKASNENLKNNQLKDPSVKKSISVDLNKEINEMIFRQKGVRPETTYSSVVARKKGSSKGRFKFFLPATAEDFRGLTSYTFAGKGKQGEADQKFFEDNIIKPYTRGISAMEMARQAFKNDYNTLLKTLPNVKKKLNKTISDTDFTNDQAIRVYLYNKSGFEVPGISKRDLKLLNNLVNNDPELKSFADTLLDISKREIWVEPDQFWDAGSILKDINSIDQTISRKEYLAEFIENVGVMFSDANLNKIEALYGPKHVEALRDIIRRMKSGSNRPPGTGDRLTTAWLNWVNNSVGTIMFFNRRSALLQMISFANFTNWSDNNPLMAATAFANQPAFWKAWTEIFNSDKLKQRRGGLKSDVQEQEIANQAKNSPNKIQATISYLLKIGFTPTQIADSVAIATGGATFLINRTKTYEKQGMTYEDARKKAFEDFSAISDETQQSGDPMLISKQQSGHLGRFILSFQNTPMQYTRLMKKAAQDLINGRGDWKTNVSKIIYYGFVQNLIFATLQNALFALLPGFDPDDDEEGYERLIDSKQQRIINSMGDTILRGSGLAGAVVSTLKNAILRYMKEEEKGFTADHAYTILELANASPPLGSKLRKVYGAIQTKRFDQDIIDARKWEATKDGRLNLSPSYKILGNLVSAGANIPLDRAIAETEAIAEALNSRNTAMQRMALALGWRTWDVNIRNEDHELIKTEAKAKRKAAGIEKAKQTRKRNAELKTEIIDNMTQKQYNAYENLSKEDKKEFIKKEIEKLNK